MSAVIFKIAIEIFLIAFATMGLMFACLTFYKGGVLQLNWDKLTEDFKRDKPEVIKVESKEE
jgi:hypothetical protein